jgi:hypothetical protein
VNQRESHLITTDDLRSWLADYGFDIHQVSEVNISLRRGSGDPSIHAWMDVTWYQLNARGERYGVRVSSFDMEPAQASTTVPLRSFPKLTEASGG